MPVILLLLAIFLIAGDASAQCSMCSATISSGIENDAESAGRGINKGILFLMGFPYLLLMGFLLTFFRSQIRDFFNSIFSKN